MKSSIFLKIGFIFFTILVFSFQSNAQEKYALKFDDGYNDTVEFIFNNPDKIHKQYFSICPKLDIKSYGVFDIDFSIMLDAKYERFINSTNNLLYVNLSGSLFESQRFENADEFDYEKFFVFGEASYSIKLLSFQKSKLKKYNFYSHYAQSYAKPGTISYHQAKLPTNVKRAFYLKGGMNYEQFTDGRTISEDNSEIRIESVSSFTTFVGLSMLRFQSIHFKSYGFGEQKGSALANLYADLLYAPIINYYGTEYDNGADELIEQNKLENSIAEYDLIKLGYRIGVDYRMSLIRRKSMGSEVFAEFSKTPGLQKRYFKLSFGYRMTFFSK